MWYIQTNPQRSPQGKSFKFQDKIYALGWLGSHCAANYTLNWLWFGAQTEELTYTCF